MILLSFLIVIAASVFAFSWVMMLNGLKQKRSRLKELRGEKRWKRKELSNCFQHLNQKNIPFTIPRPSSNNRAESTENLVFAAGVPAYSIFEFYQTVEDKKEFLDVFRYKYPNAYGDAAHSDWLCKLTEFDRKETLGALAMNWDGQKAEFLACDKLTDLGYTSPQLFEARNNPGVDVFATDANGNEIEFSVKSGKLATLKSAVRDDPESQNYIVNYELYDEAKQSGYLDELSDQGISIIDGGWSSKANRELASSELKELTESGDVVEHIPDIGILLMAGCLASSYFEYQSGRSSGMEASVNSTFAVGRMAAKSTAHLISAKAGAAIGTMIAPGVGTLIGGAIGGGMSGGTGGFGLGSIINSIRDKIKWGDVLDSTRDVGRSYWLKSVEDLSSHLPKTLFDVEEIRKQLDEQIEILDEEMVAELNSNDPASPSVGACLAVMEINRLQIMEQVATSLPEQILAQIKDQYIEVVEEQGLSRDEDAIAKYRYWGALMIENRELLGISSGIEAEAEKYGANTKSCPNHPYCGTHNLGEIISGKFVEEVGYLLMEPIDLSLFENEVWDSETESIESSIRLYSWGAAAGILCCTYLTLCQFSLAPWPFQ